MRVMTTREAYALLRTIGNGGTPAEYAQARRILYAAFDVVDRAEGFKMYGSDSKLERLLESLERLSAVERGEEPRPWSDMQGDAR